MAPSTSKLFVEHLCLKNLEIVPAQIKNLTHVNKSKSGRALLHSSKVIMILSRQPWGEQWHTGSTVRENES